ncbi:MAG TPA: pyridoxal-phosphate dependent enzyme [candidate division Zixibacteria bacterium]|nr:pyridoxal-phosphate dependent enzyme [candidate division Zixibacteria bacterium]
MINLQDIKAAADRIRPYAHITPVLTSESINEMVGAELFFKCENLQKVGAFKFRGATNAVFSLTDEEAARGVATHSSGNHAQAVALAARYRGITAHIVMPRTARRVKIDAVRGYGGQIALCEPTLKSRQETLEQVVEKTGAVVIHPYNDWKIIAGQATACLELMIQAPELDAVMAPIGGGGLLSGTSLAVRGISPDTKVYGVEPKNADDAQRSFRSGKWVESKDPVTVCDGLLTSLGDITFEVIKANVTDILTASEEAIIAAMKLVWERMKMIIEPSSAVPLACLMEHPDVLAGKRVGIIITGGNVDLTDLPWN